MNRFKCPACGEDQYTACDTAEWCIYCGNKELKKIAFDYLLKGQEYMNEFNVVWAKETKDVN
jgi:hypothetical protein